MRKTILTGATAVVLLATGAAVAQPYPPRPGVAGGGWDLHRREAWLQERIDRGRADGSLAPGEARRAQRELMRVRRDEERMRRRTGGRLTPPDRAALEARLDDVSDHIRWLRHNDVRRPW